MDLNASGVVAFTAGLSTDPYGSSLQKGFGVATGLITGPLRSVQGRDPHLTANRWLAAGRLLVFDAGAPTHPWVIFGFSRGRLTRLGLAIGSALRGSFAWSPDGKLLADEPASTVFVERANGSDRHPVARGLLSGWTPDCQLVLFSGDGSQFSAGTYSTHDLGSGARRTLLSSRQVAVYADASEAGLAELAYSADGLYLAIRALVAGQPALVIARADGSIVRVLTSTDNISMFAWSTYGHQLAYTTSGFPTPHELYVLTTVHATPWRVLSQVDHFDWVTWSPDDRWLLIDNQHHHDWELLRLTGHRQAGILAGAAVPTHRLARLGGMPMWCCPPDHYGGS